MSLTGLQTHTQLIAKYNYTNVALKLCQHSNFYNDGLAHAMYTEEGLHIHMSHRVCTEN